MYRLVPVVQAGYGIYEYETVKFHQFHLGGEANVGV